MFCKNFKYSYFLKIYLYIQFRHLRHRLEMFEMFDFLKLTINVKSYQLLNNLKKLPWETWMCCAIFLSFISEWHGMIVVMLLPIILSSTDVDMFLWLFSLWNNTFVCFIFNTALSFHETFVFISAIAWQSRSFFGELVNSNKFYWKNCWIIFRWMKM